MRKRYLIAIEGLSKDDEQKFIEFLRSRDLNWWHWIKGFWMLVDPAGTDDLRNTVRDFLKDLDTSKQAVVFELEDKGTWSGFAPKDTSDKMFRWLKSTWRQI